MFIKILENAIRKEQRKLVARLNGENQVAPNLCVFKTKKSCAYSSLRDLFTNIVRTRGDCEAIKYLKI